MSSNKDDSELTEIKKLIRSILISCQEGIEVRRFAADYEELVQKRLPWRERKFPSVSAFLQSIPDIVQFFRGPNGEDRVRHKSHESTKHIEKLVANQKSNKRKKPARSCYFRRSAMHNYDYRSGRRGGRSYPVLSAKSSCPQSLLGPVPLHHTWNMAGNNQLWTYQIHDPAMFQESMIKTSPRLSCGTVKPLNQQSKNAAQKTATTKSLKNIEADEKTKYSDGKLDCEGRERSDEHYSPYPRRYMPDVDDWSEGENEDYLDGFEDGEACRDEGKGIVEGRPQPPSPATSGSNTVYRQLVPPRHESKDVVDPRPESPKSAPFGDEGKGIVEERPQPPSPATPGSNTVYRQLVPPRHEWKDVVDARPESPKSAPFGQAAGATPATSKQVGWDGVVAGRGYALAYMHKMLDPKSPAPPGDEEKAREDGQRLDRSGSEQFADAADLCPVSLDVQNKIKLLLRDYPNGLWAKRLPVAYKDKYKRELPLQKEGFHSVIEFVSAMSHIVQCKRPYVHGDWMLFDASMTQSQINDVLSLNKSLLDQQSEMRAAPMEEGLQQDEQLLESVRQVLEASSDGLSLYQFPDIYEEMTGLKLDPAKYGCQDLSALLLCLSLNNVLRIELCGPDVSRLYAVETSSVHRYNYLKDAYKPHLYEEVQVSMPRAPSSLGIPEDAVGPGSMYKPANIQFNIYGKDSNTNYGMLVSNVVDPGLFWVQKRNMVASLDILMDNLERVYNQREDRYRMPEELIQRGMVCATQFPEDNNWHRGLITSYDNGMVEVYYVDYGNTCCVSPASIRFLRKCFMSLSVLAIQAKLACIQPPGGAANYPYNAKHAILDVVRGKHLIGMVTDIQDRVLSVILVDTNRKDEVDLYINDYLVSRGVAEYIPLPTGQASAPSVKEPIVAADAVLLKPSSAAGLRFVKQVECTGNIGFHAINIEGSLYVASAEISALFWTSDQLAEMLKRLEGPQVPCYLVKSEHCPALFRELVEFGVFFVDETTTFLYLYTMHSLPLLIGLFGNHSILSKELKYCVRACLKAFDPCDPFWKTSPDHGGAEGEDSDSEEQETGSQVEDLSLEELQMVVRTLQFQRKRLLKSIVNQPSASMEDIQSLQETEEKIGYIQNFIQSVFGDVTELSDKKLLRKQDLSNSVSTQGSCRHHPISTGPSSVPEVQKVTAVHSPSKLSTSSSCSGMASKPQPAVKTNVVAPMVNTSTAPAATTPTRAPAPAAVDGHPSVLHSSSLMANLNLAATNQRLEAIIQQQDKMLQAMLGLTVVGDETTGTQATARAHVHSVGSGAGLAAAQAHVHSVGSGAGLAAAQAHVHSTGSGVLEPRLLEHLQRQFVPHPQMAPAATSVFQPPDSRYPQGTSRYGQYALGLGQAPAMVGDNALGLESGAGARRYWGEVKDQQAVHAGTIRAMSAHQPHVQTVGAYPVHPTSSSHGPTRPSPAAESSALPPAFALQQRLIQSQLHHAQLLRQRQLPERATPVQLAPENGPAPSPAMEGSTRPSTIMGMSFAETSRAPSCLPVHAGSLMTPGSMLRAPVSFLYAQSSYGRARPDFSRFLHLGVDAVPQVNNNGDAGLQHHKS